MFANRRRFLTGLTAMCSAGAASAQPTGLEDFVGARAGQAERGVQDRGYRFVRAEQGDDRSYTFWWNADRRQCVTIATMDGRYNSITPSPPPDCRQPVNDAARPMEAMGTRPDRRPPPAQQWTDSEAVVGGRAVELGLVCFGDGRKDGLASGSRWTWNSRRDRYEYDTYTETRPEIFDASLMVQLWGDGGRIRLPKSLVPPINSRGQNGWWDLYDVRTGPDLITAAYRLNGLNKPKVSIDRRSGRITVQGFSDYGFRGTCDQMGPAGRRF